MIDFEKIDKLSCEEVASMNGLFELATAAETAAGVIGGAYLFEDKNAIEVYSINEYKEILTKEMVWQAQFTDWTYEVKCTPDGIFEFYKKVFWAHKKSKETPEMRKVLDDAMEKFKNFLVRTYHYN